MRLVCSAALLVVIGVLGGACGDTGGANGSGSGSLSELPTPRTEPPDPIPTAASSQPVSAGIADSTSVPEADTSEQPSAKLIATYGSPESGFEVTGAPAGLRITEVPTGETFGLFGETIVHQRFTAASLDSQVNIGRTTNSDSQALLDQLKASASEPLSETTSVVVGDQKYPGYFYREQGLGWRGVTWVLPDDSVLWVVTSGLTDDEILEIADHVDAVR